MNIIVHGPKLLKEMEQEVAKIKQSLKAAQDRHKPMQTSIECIESSVLGIMFTLE